MADARQSAARAAWLFAASYGGGLVGGDHLALEVDVEPGAAALLSTQASTKVYRSAAGASTRLAARVGDGAPAGQPARSGRLLRRLATIARRRRSSSIRRRGLVALDWMASGRRGSGERWAFDGYASTTTRPRSAAASRCTTRCASSAADGDLAARAGRFDVLAVLVIAGEPAGGRRRSRCWRRSRRCRSSAAAAVVVSAGAAARPGAAPPGCVVRLAGAQVEDVRRVLRGLLDFVPGLLGDDPWARKW